MGEYPADKKTIPTTFAATFAAIFAATFAATFGEAQGGRLRDTATIDSEGTMTMTTKSATVVAALAVLAFLILRSYRVLGRA